jgi:hypothetical protein
MTTMEGEREKRVDKGGSRTRDLCNSAVAEPDANHGAENATSTHAHRQAIASYRTIRHFCNSFVISFIQNPES